MIGFPPKFCMWMCLSDWTLKIYHSLYLKKSTIFGSFNILFSAEKPLGQTGCYFGKISPNTPNFANWVHWVSDRNPPIDIPNFMKIHPKKQAHIRIPAYTEYPTPPGERCQKSGESQCKCHITYKHTLQAFIKRLYIKNKALKPQIIKKQKQWNQKEQLMHK